MINKKLSKKHGWNPRWFWACTFDKQLIKKIRQFQKKCGLFPSGLCGKKTYRLILLKILLDIKKRKH
jgi:murein L,D-transpeptidase YcbB/YkuD